MRCWGSGEAWGWGWGYLRTQQCLPFISGGNSRSTVRRGPSSVEGGVEKGSWGKAGDPGSSPVWGRDCFAREKTMSCGWRARVLAAVLYPLTFPVCEEAVYSQKVIYSLIRSTSLLKRIFTSCREEAEQNSSTWSPIVSVRDYRKHCPTALSPKWGN